MASRYGIGGTLFTGFGDGYAFGNGNGRGNGYGVAPTWYRIAQLWARNTWAWQVGNTDYSPGGGRGGRGHGGAGVCAFLARSSQLRVGDGGW